MQHIQNIQTSEKKTGVNRGEVKYFFMDFIVQSQRLVTKSIVKKTECYADFKQM